MNWPATAPWGEGEGVAAWSASGTGSGSRLPFWQLMAVQTAALLGDQLLAVALPLYILDRTHTAGSVAFFMVARVLPFAALGALGGTLADRLPRRRVIVGVNSFRASTVLLLLLVPAGVLPIPWAYVVVALLASAGQLSAPAVGASVPLIVTAENLPSANARMATRTVVVQLAAPTLGALAYASQGIELVVLINAALYTVAALLTVGMRLEGTLASTGEPVLAQTLAGLRRVFRDPVLGPLISMITVALLGLSIELALVIPFVRTTLHGSAHATGVIYSLEAVGGLCGAMLTPVLARRGGVDRLCTVGMMGLPVATLGFLVSRNVPQAWPGVMLAGLLLTVLTAGIQTYLQAQVEQPYLGRALGVIGSAVGVAATLGALVAVPLAAHLGLRGSMATALLIECGGLGGYALWRRGVARPRRGRQDTEAPSPDEACV